MCPSTWSPWPSPPSWSSPFAPPLGMCYPISWSLRVKGLAPRVSLIHQNQIRAFKGAAAPWSGPLATAFVWWVDECSWATPWSILCLDDLSWWASLFILCANQHWKAPFDVFSHVFVLVPCKTIISKHMWNLVNSKYICVQDCQFLLFLCLSWLSDLIVKGRQQ